MGQAKNTRLSVGLAAAVAMTWSPVFADPPNAFVKEAIQGNIAEVQMGQLAQKNGGSDQVRSFGRMLVADHEKAQKDSEALAKSMKMAAPTEPTQEAKDAYKRLSMMRGGDFDREFASHMVIDHKKDIAKYEDEAKEKNNPSVSKYASDTLPTLRKHLQMAQALQK